MKERAAAEAGWKMEAWQQDERKSRSNSRIKGEKGLEVNFQILIGTRAKARREV